MAKTFNDLSGNTHVLNTDLFDISVDTHEDIVSNEISGYFVQIEDVSCEVNEDTYNAVKTYLENL